ncbi:LANO_0A06238g1_1 [Lachancea nothofagi CBS 11611]|uniref:Lysophospholipase n=1 Tax=Lachancea nothofagi CBS 11611 TaxID=1266666 RepID=A0A1G4IS73_9SACH|nr:LANO_0A06238g1_1 [Lachancea nothofagi CBS 11611]
MFWLLGALALVLNAVIAWSPTNGYAPGNVSCDDNINLVREATGLSANETAWLEKRDAYTKDSLKDFLDRATANFTNSSFVDSLWNTGKIPKLGVGCSGGGYRAMLSGAGMLSALDNRTDGANEHGLGGVLQAATYLAGLSGGNWLVGSLAWNNWTSVQQVIDNRGQDDELWDISNSLLNPGGINILSSASRWDQISDAVEAKQDAGFNASLTDVWGRALSYEFFPTLYRGGEGYTWSTLRDSDVFKNAEMPFPISVADGRYPGTQIVDLNSTVFEFNPFEMGSWDPSLNAFTDVKYLGTNVTNGTPVTQGKCVAGFDNAGFIMGTSSSLFNQFLLQLNTTGLSSFIKGFVGDFLQDLSNDSDDIAIYNPNPFKDTHFVSSNHSQSIVTAENLYLVDGGEDGENIPFLPLLQKDRDLDVIFALDNSADTDQYWPAGLSLISTYERQFGSLGKDLAFPYVPDVDTFVNSGLNTKPTFFGCDATNLTGLAYTPPLIVYMPNNRQSYNSNTSTFKMSYSSDQRMKMFQNGFEAITRNNLTDDSAFTGCVACAIMKRKQESLNMTLPEECTQCFKDYCWDGKLATKSSNVTTLGTYSGSISFVTDSASSSSTASSTSKKNNAVALSQSYSMNWYVAFAAILGVTLGLL